MNSPFKSRADDIVCGESPAKTARCFRRVPPITTFNPTTLTTTPTLLHNAPHNGSTTLSQNRAPVSSRLHLSVREHRRALATKTRSSSPPFGNKQRSTRSNARTRPGISGRGMNSYNPHHSLTQIQSHLHNSAKSTD